MSQSFTRAQVEATRSDDSKQKLIIIDSVVYDITKVRVSLLPLISLRCVGGELLLLEYAGKDATEQFYNLHRHEVLVRYARLAIGQIESETPKLETDFAAFSNVPFAEHPSVVTYSKSPYYTDEHRAYRKVVREFVNKHVLPDALECEDSGSRPSKQLNKLMAAEGYLTARLGPGRHLKMMNGRLPGNLSADKYDYFHEQITHEEFCRVMCRGYADGCGGGMIIGLPPVVNFAKKHVREKVVPEVLNGDKYAALAISEAFAGSDVAGLATRAEKTPDGKFFIVNGYIRSSNIYLGTKKWITGGMYADYFSTAVRTSKGISMLLIERSEGVSTKRIKTSYSPTAGTAYITFENVKVPVENLLGIEDKGFMVVMSNFNHERWAMCVGVNRATRYVIEECFKWANQRKVFGKKLLAQPVIRQKLAEMVSLNEAMTQWVDHLTYQMNNHTYMEQATVLAGPLALLKYQCTRVAHLVADQAVQIFGGRGITKTGMGRVIEGFHRGHKFE
ncbi:MAG: hypothetical protein SGCHY_003687 [Lobulomycetales sp.]